ncbi:MAG: hypothetical protein K0R80_2791 [Clostridia bacterium]|jgi:hypothetical protein|nr:hypothetical protein [Clostridia bacterium]
MAFAAYFTFTIIKTKIVKYILTPIISVLYGFILFYIGMGISGIFYYVLAVLPVIAVIFHIILLKKAK